MQIKGKTALVTGGASRIGKAIAEALSQRGARVAVHHHRAREGEGKNGFRADFTRPGEAQNLVTEVETQLGPIHILINNAAVFERTPLWEIDEADWEKHLAVNLKAPFFLAQAVSKKMAELKEGCIINIGDPTLQRPHKGYLSYNVSKAGLEGLSRALAMELAPSVRVNTLALGPILPPEDYTEEQKLKAAQKTLLKQWGKPEEVAKAVCFLIEEASFATGSTLLLDGGRLLA